MGNKQWISTEYFCPFCGNKSVWMDNDEYSDYYTGPAYVCLSCAADFCLPHYAIQTGEYNAIIDALREPG